MNHPAIKTKFGVSAPKPSIYPHFSIVPARVPKEHNWEVGTGLYAEPHGLTVRTSFALGCARLAIELLHAQFQRAKTQEARDNILEAIALHEANITRLTARVR